MRSRFDRLTSADLTNLLAERPGTPWHIGLVGVLDGARLTDANGQLRLELVRETIRPALSSVPRLRHVVHRTRVGQGRPVWVDADRVDLDQHVQAVPVGPPGDQSAFLRAVESVLVPAMDLSRPLWDLTLLSGLAGGRVGVVLRLHHALADGETAVRLVSALLDGLPASGDSQVREPSPPVTPAQLALDAWRVRAVNVRGALGHRPHPRDLIRSSRALSGQLGALLRPGEPVPRTSLTRPIGSQRRLAVLQVPLEPVHRVAQEHGASINDAVLAAVAGGVRAVLAARGERTDVTLRASVPVSLHPPNSGPAASPGNRVGVLVAPLPVSEPDPVLRMARIAISTRREKDKARQAGALAVMTSTLGLRLAMPLLRHQRLVSLFVTNVRGPMGPLALAGAGLLEAYPAAPIAGNVTLGVGVLSYAGNLGLGVVADADAWPDLPVFVEGLRDSLAALIGAPTRPLDRPAASPDGNTAASVGT